MGFSPSPGGSAICITPCFSLCSWRPPCATWTTGKSVPGYPSLVIGLMTIGGVQLIMIGIVGEYIGKILSELKARPIYFVAEHSVKRIEPATSEDVGERTAAE